MNLLLAALVTVASLVVDSTGAPLPGVTVTLSNGTLTRTTVTDEHGRYEFDGVREGTYDFRYEIDGLEPGEQRTHTDDVRPHTLEFVVAEPITNSCGYSPCSPDPPATSYDRPLCADYDLNESLLEAAAKGDRSARELLRTRYARALSFSERHHIAPALLDDSAIWSDVFPRAEVFLRFPRVEDALSPQYVQWCDARNLPPDEYWLASYDALLAIHKDPRARPLLRKALQSEEVMVAWIGVLGLSEQREASALRAIDETLRRFPTDAASMAMCLVSFASPAADEVAMKYLHDDMHADYAQARAEQR
jgi:hypothetical protein